MNIKTNVKADISEATKGLDRFDGNVDKNVHVGMGMIADEVLRRSGDQVPHDKGTLAATGKAEPVKKNIHRVSYNIEYAARLHEHPEYNFQKGRKGKYLEDPFKEISPKMNKMLKDIIKSRLRI